MVSEWERALSCLVLSSVFARAGEPTVSEQYRATAIRIARTHAFHEIEMKAESPPEQLLRRSEHISRSHGVFSLPDSERQQREAIQAEFEEVISMEQLGALQFG